MSEQSVFQAATRCDAPRTGEPLVEKTSSRRTRKLLLTYQPTSRGLLVCGLSLLNHRPYPVFLTLFLLCLPGPRRKVEMYALSVKFA
jgi:hypothetical protein